MMLPSCLFNGVKGSEYGKIPPYIFNKYSDLELQEQIKSNLQIDTLCEEVIVTYIISLTINHKDIRLKTRLEELSSMSPEDNLYIANLIFLNSKYGLEAYLKTCKETMKSTSIPNTSRIDSVLETICVISDVALLDTLGELRVLLYTDGFEDLDSFGLNNSLYKAYQNLSIYDFDSVKEHLNEALSNPDICDGEKSFCNMLLRDIQNTNDQKNDVAWSIEDIKKFLTANE